MSNKKNSRPGAATPERPAIKGKITLSSAYSLNDHITAQQREQGPIEKTIPRGAANAISTADLVELAGCKTKRQLQNMIAAERARGALILSSTSGGYFLPAPGQEGREELRRFVATLQSRAVSTLRTLQEARIALAVLDGQLSFIETQRDAGVQPEDAAYEREKKSGPLAICHVDETTRRQKIAEKVGV